ncbi:unnamed protein product, partial [Ceratitis capitata]
MRALAETCTPSIPRYQKKKNCLQVPAVVIFAQQRALVRASQVIFTAVPLQRPLDYGRCKNPRFK